MAYPAANRAVFLAAAIAMGWTSAPVRAQEADLATELQCLRYVQAYERSLTIPAGLLTAISYVEAGRPMQGKVVAWPWTINVNGQGRYFETKEEAVRETRKLIDEGQRSIDVGCLQVNLRFHPNAFRSLDDAFEPATNVAYGAGFLKSLHTLQGSWPKAIERYHSSDDARRDEYREKVLAFWNNDARNMIMDAVIAESTDTPYHRALRDYLNGDYNDAVAKYQDVVDNSSRDRIGLLGLAMSYEKLGRDKEALDSYRRYLVVEPANEEVASRVLQKALVLPRDEARARVESFVTAGVQRHDFLSALAELTSASGENEKAFQYAVAAAAAAQTDR